MNIQNSKTILYFFFIKRFKNFIKYVIIKIIKVGKDMKKIFLIALMFLFIGNVNAEECTEQKLNELKQQAESIVIDVEFDEEAMIHQQYDTRFLHLYKKQK